MSQNRPRRSARRGGRGAPPGRRYWWPVALVTGGLLLLGAAALALRGGGGGLQVTPQVSGAPALRADQEKMDLGDVRLGKTVQVQFTLANVGDQPLRFVEKPYVEVVEGC
ncbi:MAG: hypothetical protein HY784_16845 [Chloroflexi bacterium]|nr:hypothetical protein [Chloroflexota bacterium]